ncbi:glycerophosphodiester phosphodiesterase [Phenylobacterium deserti]|uniref:glycerophosphodiester phosphodiesterase n=1 Tax=Phenylobacterium deserti TaxID=1914756 RepID=A0A328AA85_9CAUL|nr:glycerophosphodiester phosphodiesterase [Phenylobacterium deserti]RAK51560.1 glycerophosphodiester phosphodiesterase [Phenylobacterium deserti]
MSLRVLRRSVVAAAALAVLPLALQAAEARKPPLVIAHRGASGERPEHTAASYRLAIAQGADFIEPDLVATKDGELVARHENEISATTDVAARPEFASRRTTKTIDGRRIEGWFTEDFTLAELRTLRARERLPQLRAGNAAFDGQEPLLTLREIIALARNEGRKAGRQVGVYAELKHPSYFAGIGLPLEPRLVAVLKEAGLASRSAPFIVESFEPSALRNVRALAPVRTVFLMAPAGAPPDSRQTGDERTYADFTRAGALREIAGFADGIGPDKQLIVPRDAAGRSQAPTRLVEDAHAAGLFVHPYTFRSENLFLPVELRAGESANPSAPGDWKSEYLTFFRLGVDGVFSDFPAAAVSARRDFLAQ